MRGYARGVNAGDDTAINSLHRADTLPMGAVPDPAPDLVDGTVYVVRRNRRHLMAGRVLGRIDAHSGHQARSRAAGHLGVALLPWQPLDEDAGWWTATGLLVEQYALVEHANRWLLLGDVTRIPRPRVVTDEDAQMWAEDVLRTGSPLRWERGSKSTWFSSNS